MSMIRLARIFLVTLLLGPQVAMVVLRVQPACQECRDCCDPEGVCDVNCLQCACCASRVPTLNCSSSIELIAADSGTPAVAAVATPPQPAPRDILILTKLRHAVPTLVTRDPAQWSTYSVKPLTLAPTPCT